MKLLTFLAVAQTALILILLMKFIDLDRRVDTAPREVVAATEISNQSVASPRALDEGRLRQIVREEVGALLNTFTVAAPPSAAAKDPEPVSAAEYQYRLEAAMQNLDSYIEQGEISDMDMANLQGEIARLDNDGRRQMLSLLTQALNSGELEGRF
jgi:hypothetical protein